MLVNWENFRDKEGSIDLVAVYKDLINVRKKTHNMKAVYFLLDIMDLNDVRSPQAAAIALTYALQMEA